MLGKCLGEAVKPPLYGFEPERVLGSLVLAAEVAFLLCSCAGCAEVVE